MRIQVVSGAWALGLAAAAAVVAAAPAPPPAARPAAVQQIIENPGKPPAPNAGRVVPLEEVARITEERGKFFFAEPIDVFTGSDGSVYVQEYKQFLKFDAQGRFAGNLLKRGEGPGELSDNLTDVIVRADDILFYSSNNLKFIRIGLDGRLLEDRRFARTPFSRLLGLRGGRYLFLKHEWGERPVASGIYEMNYRLVLVPENGEAVETPHLFSQTDSWQLGPRSVSIMSISRLMATWVGDRDVFLFSSPEYLIKRLDLETGEIGAAFRREYDRVKFDAKERQGYPAGLAPRYHNDLCRLVWRNDRLWAVTSTFDPKKGILVDVFSRDGKYLDNFYLPLFKIRRHNPQYYAPMAIHGDFLYVLEPDEEGLITLVKYRLGGE